MGSGHYNKSDAAKGKPVNLLNGGRKIFLFLDFDGTISPITREPKDAILPSDIKIWLRKLSGKKNVKIGIVTGRALSDIRRKVGLKNIVYAANHGMEIFHNGKYLLRKGLVYRKPLRALAGELRAALSDVPGAIVENKQLSVAVHFRKVNTKFHPALKRGVRKLSKAYMKKYNLQLTRGKMILEIRPAKLWNKGKAVMWMWQKLAPKHLPIYIGDDITDEDAFKALYPYDSITVRIGMKKNSHAKFIIKSVKNIFGHSWVR